MRPCVLASLAILALGLGSFSPAARSAPAFDRIAVEGGSGNRVYILGVDIATPQWAQWTVSDTWSLQLYGKTGVALWVGGQDGTPNRYLFDFSAYPVLRLQKTHGAPYEPYIEGGIGGNLLTNTRIDNKNFSIAFQFGEFLGAGVLFGDKREYELGLRLQHVSNGDIKSPNDGITFGLIVFQYRFGGP